MTDLATSDLVTGLPQQQDVQYRLYHKISMFYSTYRTIETKCTVDDYINKRLYETIRQQVSLQFFFFFEMSFFLTSAI